MDQIIALQNQLLAKQTNENILKGRRRHYYMMFNVHFLGMENVYFLGKKGTQSYIKSFCCNQDQVPDIEEGRPHQNSAQTNLK